MISDIIKTIETTAEDYLQKYGEMPRNVVLSENEYHNYLQAKKEGRTPKIEQGNKVFRVEVRML
jgi:hypothetical protein